MSFDRPQELLKPVRRRFIFLSFSLVVLFEFLPLPSSSILWLPDFIGLLILYWVINQPRRVNIGVAFLFGIIADIATSSMFGQHALAYSITSYLALIRQRQLVMFNLGQQTLVVLGLLFTNQFIMVLVRMAVGDKFIGLIYFFPPILGALLWPLLNKLLLLPYHRHKV